MNNQEDMPPSYFERCSEMEFDELHEFLVRTLEGNTDDPDIPRSEAEFIFLVETLKEKAPPAPPPKPETSSDDISPPEIPEYEPSDRVIELSDQRAQILRALEEQESRSVPQSQAERRKQRKEKKALKAEIQELDRKIYPLEIADAERHKEQLAAYEGEFQAYQEKLRTRAARSRALQEKNEDNARAIRGSELTKERMRIVSEVRAKVRSAFVAGANVPRGRFSWVAVPQGTLSQERVTSHYDDLHRRGVIEKYDKDRLDKAFSLNPARYHLGTGEAEGYTIFTFSHTTKFLMERPEVGNAIYVVDSPAWEDWTLLTKQQLMEHPEVTRIPHQGDWFERVKQVLETSESQGGR